MELRTGRRGFSGPLLGDLRPAIVDVQHARAIWGRVVALPGATEPLSFLDLDEPTLRTAGLSGGKVNSMRAVAEAVVSVALLDFAAIEALPAEEAIAHLTAIKGIGPWTAELYLLFCAGHPDIFPAGDLALKKAVRDGLGLGELPSTKELIEIAAEWSPHRGAATLLFFRYFHALPRQGRGRRMTTRLSGPMLPPRDGTAAKQAVVLLHGSGSDGRDLIGLAGYWRDLLPGALFVAPNAPNPC